MFADFVALELSKASSTQATEDQIGGGLSSGASGGDIQEQGLTHLELARSLCMQYPAQTKAITQEEMDSLENMIESEFYQEVSNDERRQIVATMAQDFHGTGHWYTCENGHPFTIGECRLPTQQARYPQCNASIGGLDHQLEEGVQRAHGLEGQMDDMSL